MESAVIAALVAELKEFQKRHVQISGKLDRVADAIIRLEGRVLSIEDSLKDDGK